MATDLHPTIGDAPALPAIAARVAEILAVQDCAARAVKPFLVCCCGEGVRDVPRAPYRAFLSAFR